MSGRLVVEVERDLEGLMPLFMQTRAKDMAGLDAGLVSRDFAAMRLIGHSMKGAGGAYGFPRVSEIGARIETAALAEDATVIAAELALLRDYFARLDIHYV